MGSANESSIVTKVGQTLDIMTRARRPLTFSELVERTGFVKSSAHRILSIMLGERLLEHDPANKTYSLGPRLIHWAQTAWQRTDLQEVAGPELQRFCERTGLNVALSILDQDKVLYLRTLDALPVRYVAHAGERAPLHCTGVGKVYLAFMPKMRREGLLSRLKLDRYTEHTIQSPKVLAAELERVRARGYGTCDREEFLHVVGMAAPILDSGGEVLAGVSVWTTTEHADMARLEASVQDLLAMTRRISHMMGHSSAERPGSQGIAPETV